MLFDYANVLVFLGLGLFLCAMMMGLGSLLRPANPEQAKLTTYECGEEVQGDSWINFNIRFYLVALVFLIFDIEVAFIYPIVAVFKQWVADGNGMFALAEMFIFFAILVAGLVYVWTKGDLQWVMNVAVPEKPAREDEDPKVGGTIYVAD